MHIEHSCKMDLFMTTLDNEIEATPADQVSEAGQLQVWDLPVRLFHWTLVAAIIGAFVTNKLGIAYFEYHVWCGYTIIILVLFRLVWGFAGTRHALFLNFVRGPIETLRYAVAFLRGEKRHFAGHNPLGAWMVLVLLSALAVQAISGLFGNDEIFNFGPLYGYVSKEFSLRLTSLHRLLFYWILAAVALHVLAVIVHEVFKRERLVKAMITGRKPEQHLTATDVISSSRLWLAVLIVIGLSFGLASIIKHAPAPGTEDSAF
jgi:cytochrome b